MLGRWMQRDPLGYVDGGSLYEYVRSNPTQYMDSYGLSTEFSSEDNYRLNPFWRRKVTDEEAEVDDHFSEARAICESQGPGWEFVKGPENTGSTRRLTGSDDRLWGLGVFRIDHSWEPLPLALPRQYQSPDKPELEWLIAVQSVETDSVNRALSRSTTLGTSETASLKVEVPVKLLKIGAGGEVTTSRSETRGIEESVGKSRSESIMGQTKVVGSHPELRPGFNVLAIPVGWRSTFIEDGIEIIEHRTAVIGSDNRLRNGPMLIQRTRKTTTLATGWRATDVVFCRRRMRSVPATCPNEETD